MSATGGRLLLIDDDTELCRLMARLLSAEGFVVVPVHTGEEGLKTALGGGFDLVLLDVMLSGIDGFEILFRLRERSVIPILMLTARAEQSSRVRGLTIGADDYLTKPFDPLELIARIRAILRRTATLPFDPLALVAVGAITLDSRNRSVTKDGEPVRLTSTEFDILEMLMRSAGHVVPRIAIGHRLYQRETSQLDRSLEVHISSIRKKLGADRDFVKTVRGLGYMFATREGALS